MTQGNGEKAQRAAENAVLTLVARLGIIGICSVALPVGAWMGARLVTTLDKVVEKVDGLTLDVAVMKTDITYLRRKIDP